MLVAGCLDALSLGQELQSPVGAGGVFAQRPAASGSAAAGLLQALEGFREQDDGGLFRIV